MDLDMDDEIKEYMDMDADDDEDIAMIFQSQNDEKEPKQKYGRGNAKKGWREIYNLYPPSDVIKRVKLFCLNNNRVKLLKLVCF